MLKLNELQHCEELDREALSGVRGGFDPFAVLASTHIDNRVADVNQLFALQLEQANAGAVTNNQAILGGNGTSYAPVHQDQHQHNNMYLSGIGNTSV
ncbi:hypothetical protein [Parahaliea mediterranea]|uniref:Uncharacterized protein n=1 Tax=Parahaliea mediterranea TaxID=651086 RepID=A0A939IKI5_9GAMM|nr:hypothetical protein [Parahaliea mediterranea]MBN7795002.1 hypothetical protein [Parahaliea mediterranea]